MSTFIFRIWCNCCIFPTRWCIDVISRTNKSRLVHNWSYWHLFESLQNETKLQRRKPKPCFFNCCWIRFRNCSPKVICLFKATHSMDRLSANCEFRFFMSKTIFHFTGLTTKALINYHVRNGRMQNSLLSSLLCSAIDGFKLF